MKPLIALSVATMRDIIYQKLLYNFLIFGVVFVFASLLIVHLTIGQWERLITDVGVSSIGVVASLIAVILGSGLLAKEVERRTLYFVLSKPVSRAIVVMSKFLGLNAIIALNSAAMLALVMAILRGNAFALPSELAASALGSFAEAMILSAFAILFSTFTTPALAAGFSLAIFLVGHLVNQVDFLAARVGGAFKVFGSVLKVVMPDFELLNFKMQAVEHVHVSGPELAHACLYAVGYSGVILILASCVFHARDLK